MIILGVLIWFLIKCIKKRKRKRNFFECEESSTTSSTTSFVGPPNSTIIQIEPENKKCAAPESSVLSIDNSRSEEEGKLKPIKNLKEKSSKSQTSTTKSQQSPAPAGILSSSKLKHESLPSKLPTPHGGT